MSSETVVTITCDRDIVAARQQGRILVVQLGFSRAEALMVATAISELARNIVLYAGRGEVVLRALEEEGRSGVLVIARDEGPGMPDLQQATPETASRLGLRGLKCLMDSFELVSRRGGGVTVSVTKWKAPR